MLIIFNNQLYTIFYFETDSDFIGITPYFNPSDIIIWLTDRTLIQYI